MAKKSLKTARLALETSPTPKASGDVPTQTVTPLNDLPILISSTGQNVNLDTSFVVGYAHDSTGSPYAVRMTLRQLMAYVGGSGEPGAPGDYTSFAFKKSDDQPATPQSSSPLPEGWSVLPDSDGKWWVSSSKVSGSTNTTYGGWGLPQPITAEDGTPGSMGPVGPFIETRYAANNSYTEAPALANPALRDPEGWVVGSQFDAGDQKAVWTINAKISSETDALMTNWSTPFCLTGGVPDYQINRFKKSDTAPSAPTSQSQNPSGWLEAPDSTGKWWMTVGLVNGADGLVKGWSTPIQATGEDGVASYDISDGAEFSITALHSAIEGYPSSPLLGYINGTFNFYGLGLSAKETYSGSIRNDSTATVRLSYSYFGSGSGTNVQIINGIFLPCSSSSNVSSSNSSIAHFIDKVQLQPGASMKFNLAVGNLDYPVSGQMSARMYITNASDFEYSYTSNSASGRPPRIGGANFRGADFSVASSLVGILRYEYDGNGDRLSTIIVNKLRSGLQYNVVSESKFSITFSLSGTDCPTGQSLAVLAQSSRSKSGSFMYPVYACVDYDRTASPIQFTVSTIAGASGSSLDYGGAVLVFIYDMGDTSSL